MTANVAELGNNTAIVGLDFMESHDAILRLLYDKNDCQEWKHYVA